MAKGASIKFQSYSESIPKLLSILNLQKELKKYDKIVLKPYLSGLGDHTPAEFTEQVLKFCIENKNPVAEIFIAEGADGYDTTELFQNLGYTTLAEKYSIGQIDLNNTETEEIKDGFFLRFQEINFPKILSESFVISIPRLFKNGEFDVIASLSNMLGAFPS